MARLSVALVVAGLLLITCAGNAQAWRLFPSFATGYWSETAAPACPSFNASTEPELFKHPPHPEHNDTSPGEFGPGEPGDDDKPEPHEPNPPHPHPPHPHPPHPHPPHPHPPRPFPGPPFYHGAAGPRFRVVNRTCGYETRKYTPSTWLLTNSTGWSWEFAVRNGFLELDPYFHGENANNSHFPPSTPIVSHFRPRKNFSDTGKQFLVARFVPKKGCHKNSTWVAPKPDNEKLRLKKVPAHKAYVRTFPGLGLHWAVLAEMRALRHDLKRDGIAVKKGRFFAAQYDPPYAILHRHNEVWFVPTPGNKTEAADLGLDSLWTEGGWALDADLDESS